MGWTRQIVVFLGVLLLARASWGRPFGYREEGWEGCSEFANVAAEVAPRSTFFVSKIDFGQLSPEDAIVVVHPLRSLDIDNFSRWLKKGGRAVILDDYGTGDAFFRHYGIERVPLPTPPLFMLRGNPSLALAEVAGTHSTVRDVERVVVNHAVGLRQRDLSPVLKVRGKSGEEVMVALAGMVENGRLLAVGDASIVINEMMRYPGNRAFARGLIRYVAEDDHGLVRGRIYFVSEDFEQTGAFGEGDGWWSSLGAAVRDALDAASRVRREGVSPGVALGFAFMGGLLLVLWVGRVAGRTHRALVPRFARPVPLVAQGGVAGHRALLAAPTTPRTLAMLELKRALEEELARLLGLGSIPGPEELLHKVAQANLLSHEALSVLRRLLLVMSEIETMMLSKHARLARSVSDREVVRTAQEVHSLLRAARGSAGAGV